MKYNKGIEDKWEGLFLEINKKVLRTAKHLYYRNEIGNSKNKMKTMRKIINQDLCMKTEIIMSTYVFSGGSSNEGIFIYILNSTLKIT